MHHFHKRKRIHKNLEEYPSSNKLKKSMDYLIIIVAIFGPLTAIPQILLIWSEKNAAGVSKITWGAYLMGGFMWLVYGIMHKEKPIIFTNLLWIIMFILILIGAFLYG